MNCETARSYRGRSWRNRQLFPRLEATPDINRGEERLAAEVALAWLRGDEATIPAVQRAIATLQIMARQ